jgi:cytochrome c556
MKAFKAPLTALAATLLLSQAGAIPAVPAVPIVRRQAFQIASAIAQIFGEIFKGANLAFDKESLRAW